MHAVFEAVIQRISPGLKGLPSEAAQLSPKGTAHARSPQRAVEDLLQGYRFGAETLERCLQSGRVARTQNRSCIQWTLQIMVLSLGYLPAGAELPAPLKGKPVKLGPMSGSELLRVLGEELGTLDSLLDRCRVKFGMELVASDPLLGPLRVDQWRRLYAVYTAYYFKHVYIVKQVDRGLAHSVKLKQEMQIPAHRSVT